MNTQANKPILPGATVGVLGSGQLGRMFAIASRRMGYRVHTFSPDSDTPTGQIADLEVEAAYEDLDAVRQFARHVDVVTFEFENVPFATVQAAEEMAPVRPRGEVLHITQHRLREKQWLLQHGFPVAPFAHIRVLDDLIEALETIGAPAILKTAGFGYDGKGQTSIDAIEQAQSAFAELDGQDGVLEKRIGFAKEVSVVAARGIDGSFAHYGVVENQHIGGILDLTIAPAKVELCVAAEAVEITEAVLNQLDVVGVLCVEFFVTPNGGLMINELAPRPHNSGHFSFDACTTSQFEQQLRAVCGLPLGSTQLLQPAAMSNLLGDLWFDGDNEYSIPDWQAALKFPNVKLHLYGKAEARMGRKMGHLTALADTSEEAARVVQEAREALINEPLA
ncbi:MAG TPA: 5-(carboxyamino)imidazole ribonucleotide synthase [Abditibacteriaceae bacterium]|nr:5-(carboxyamino)imidazole ribonucleotide synthase [Abditibacteriaceae bacterium]